jgi:predicted nucleic acid-binding protein
VILPKAGGGELILVDTSAFIEFLNRTGSREDQIVEQLVEQLVADSDEIAIPDISLTEILLGVRDVQEYAEVKSSLLTFPILSLTGANSYIAAADLYRKCRKKGATVRNTFALLIAQIAIEHKATLLHNDRDFDAIAKICELKLYKK